MKTLLVLDEDKEALDYIRDLLKDSEYAGLFAGSREEALRLAACAESVDLLLASVPVSPQDTEELAALLASCDPGMGAVFMSSHSLQTLERNGIRFPGPHFLRKPFSRVRLLEVLDAACASATATAATEAAASLDQAA